MIRHGPTRPNLASPSLRAILACMPSALLARTSRHGPGLERRWTGTMRPIISQQRGGRLVRGGFNPLTKLRLKP